jgi:hypothetical protein
MLLSESGKVCTREDSIAYLSPIGAIDFLGGASKNSMGLGLQVARLLGAAAVLPARRCTSAVPHLPQVLLLIHLRILFQSLGCRSGVARRSLQVVVHELARLSLVWVANQYMSIYSRLRLEIKHEQVEIKPDERKVDDRKAAC